MDAQQIRIPSEGMCIRIMADLGMLENIMAHCLQVCRVSLLLNDHLGFPALNRDLIRASAFLHDITKTRSFQTHEDHAETGARLLRDLGYPEVANIVGQHVHLDRYFASESTTEAEIVNYADKRVLHDKIVPLSERMGYILEKYGSAPERKRAILLLWEKTERLEERLFDVLPFSPGEISRLLEETHPGRCREAFQRQ